MTGNDWLSVLEIAFRTEKHRTEKMMARIALRIRSPGEAAGGGALTVMAGNLASLAPRTSARGDGASSGFAWVTATQGPPGSQEVRSASRSLSLGHSISEITSRIAMPPAMPTKRSTPGMMLSGGAGPWTRVTMKTNAAWVPR